MEYNINVEIHSKAGRLFDKILKMRKKKLLKCNLSCFKAQIFCKGFNFASYLAAFAYINYHPTNVQFKMIDGSFLKSINCQNT